LLEPFQRWRIWIQSLGNVMFYQQDINSPNS
jgi:hypothetical protein